MDSVTFEKAVEDKKLKVLSPFRGSSKKVLLKCHECGHEWEKVARDLVRFPGRGCKLCSVIERRKPNEILLEVGNVLVLNTSSTSWPGSTMLIYKKKWEILQRRKIGRVFLCKKGYPKATLNGRDEFIHRILMGFPQSPNQVDHINGIKTDNRMVNLRIVTALENQMNRGLRKTNKSGIIGVHEKKPGVWEARLKVGGKTVHRSLHKTKEDALEVRRVAVEKHCGDYAPRFSLD